MSHESDGDPPDDEFDLLGDRLDDFGLFVNGNLQDEDYEMEWLPESNGDELDGSVDSCVDADDPHAMDIETFGCGCLLHDYIVLSMLLSSMLPPHLLPR